MSGEFGQFDYRGYIDTVIKTIADECLHKDEQLTRLFGGFLQHVAEVAKDIVYLEAGDNGVESTARNLKAHIPKIIEAIDRLHEIAIENAEGQYE